MNYDKIYNNLIASARARLVQNTYTERHHIIPRCLNGGDEQENLVRLTAREHFLAHWLLHKIHPKNHALAGAWNSFNRSGATGERLVSHHYERAKKAWIKVLHERKLTDPEWWHNWTMASAGTVWMNNGVKNVRPKQEQVFEYESKGYKFGRITFTRSPHSEEHKTKIGKANKGNVSPMKGRKISSHAQIDGVAQGVKTRLERNSYTSGGGTCVKCNQYFKNKSGLTFHTNRCKIQP